MLKNLLALYSRASGLMFKGILVVGVLVIILKGFFLAVSSDKPLSPQSDITQRNRAMIYATLNDKEKSKTFKDVYRWSTCFMSGEACTDNPADGDKNGYNSLLGKTLQLAMLPLANPPATTLGYAQETLSHTGFISKAHAVEGIGFSSIKNYLSIWKAFRDLTFLLMVFFFVIVGIMMMLRFKINPQTVVTIENALPRFVMTLIYISFSFAIAGFIIDLTYLIIFFILEVAAASFPGMPIDQLHNQFVTGNILGITSALALKDGGLMIYFNALKGIYALFPLFLQIPITIVGLWANVYIYDKLSTSIAGKLSGLFGLCEVTAGFGAGIGIKVCLIIFTIVAAIVSKELAPAILYMIGFAVILIGFLFLLFRLLFLLIGAYVQIVISIIFAPIFILQEVIPGQSGFVPWVKNLFGHLMVFPTVITLFLVVRAINTIGTTSTHSSFTMPLLFNFETDALVAIVTGVFMLMIPDLTKQVVGRIAGKSSIQANAGVLFGGAMIAARTAFGMYGQASAFSKLPMLTGGVAGGPPVATGIGGILNDTLRKLKIIS